MKLKTLVKLNEIREKPSKIMLHDCYNNEVYYLNVTEYLTYKESEITDWNITGNEEEGYTIEVWL